MAMTSTERTEVQEQCCKDVCPFCRGVIVGYWSEAHYDTCRFWHTAVDGSGKSMACAATEIRLRMRSESLRSGWIE